MTAWRIGRTLGRTLYRNGQCVGIVDTPEIALQIVAACRLASLIEDRAAERARVGTLEIEQDIRRIMTGLGIEY